MKWKIPVGVCLPIVFHLILMMCNVTRADYDEMCSSEICQKTARIFSTSMNRSADPCSDFYSYTCGSLPVNDDKVADNDDSEERLVDTALNLIYKTGRNETVLLRRLKTYFTGCLNSSAGADRGTLFNIFSKLGFDSNWDASYWTQTTAHFDWINTAKVLVDGGFIRHFLLNLEVHQINDSSKQLRLTNNYAETYENNWILLKELRNVQPFARKDSFLDKVLDFERNLKAISAQPRASTESREETTIKNLSMIAPSIPWLTYIQTIVSSLTNIKIDENQKIVIQSAKFIQDLEQLIQITPGYVILNYIAYSIHISYLINTEGPRIHDARQKSCFERNPFKKIMPTILAEVMTKEEKSKQNRILNLAKTIRQEFSTFINETWHEIEEITKVNVLKKLQSTPIVVAYPKITSDMRNVLHYFSDLELEVPGIWSINLQVSKFNLKREIEEMANFIQPSYHQAILHQTVPYSSLKYTQVYRNNPSSADNSHDLKHRKEDNYTIYISPTGLRNYGINDQPEYLNLATVGWDIAQMMAYVVTHNIDAQIKENAKYENVIGADCPIRWSLIRHSSIAHCFMRQYGVIKRSFLELTMETKIPPLNLAFEIVNRLYRKWLDANAVTHQRWKLPDHNNTLDQMFFISAGLQHCRKNHNGFEVPSRRVFELVGKNFPEFAEAFSCKRGTTMNPERKCKFIIEL